MAAVHVVPAFNIIVLKNGYGMVLFKRKKKKKKDTEGEYYSSFGHAHFNLILDIFISGRIM